MNTLNFQQETVRALQSDADFVTIVAPAGHGKTTLAHEYGGEGTKIIDPADDITWESFEAIMQSRPKRVVLTLNKQVNQLGLHDRIKTRISQGLIVQMYPPNGFERMDIVPQLGLPEMYAQEIARQIISFPALVGVAAAYKFEKPSGAEGIQEILSRYGAVQVAKLIIRESPKTVLDTVLDVAEQAYFAAKEHILGTKRNIQYTRPRHICVYAMRELTDLSLEDIGAMFANRDHSTIIHSISKVKGCIVMREEADKLIERVRAGLTGAAV